PISHRHRPGAGAAAQDPGARRTGVGAGRIDSGRHHQSAARSAGAVRAVLPVRLARPVGGAASGPPGRGDAPRGDRRTGRGRSGVHQPPPRLHETVAGRDAATGTATPLESVGMTGRPFARADRNSPRHAGRRAILRLLAVGMVVVLALAGCAREDTDTPAAGGPAELGTTNDINPQDPADLEQGGNLRLALTALPPNFNPLHIDGNVADAAGMLKATPTRAFRIAPDGTATATTAYFPSIEL